MKFYPLGLDLSLFANISVTASYAVSSSFINSLVPSASYSLVPTGSKGETGDSGGKVYLLSSSLLVCVGSTTTTTSTTTTSTTTTSTTTTSTTSTTTTTTTEPPTTTTTTSAPVCGGYCEGPKDCGVGCICTEIVPGLSRCVDSNQV